VLGGADRDKKAGTEEEIGTHESKGRRGYGGEDDKEEWEGGVGREEWVGRSTR
jgi:hypothetical protein